MSTILLFFDDAYVLEDLAIEWLSPHHFPNFFMTSRFPIGDTQLQGFRPKISTPVYPQKIHNVDTQKWRHIPSRRYIFQGPSCFVLLMEEIVHQLRLVVYPMIYDGVLYIPGDAGFLPSTVSILNFGDVCFFLYASLSVYISRGPPCSRKIHQNVHKFFWHPNQRAKSRSWGDKKTRFMRLIWTSFWNKVHN